MKNALCILVLFPQFVFAQPDSVKATHNPLINVSSGISFSPARVSNASANLQWMDYAKLGINEGIAADLPLFHSFWGICTSFDYMHNGYDMNKYVAQQQAANLQSTVTSVSYGAFNQYFFMLGAFASLTCNKLTFEVWAQAGLEYLVLPNYEDNFVFQTNEAAYNYTKIYNRTWAAAFSGGIRASYRINKKISATAHIGLLVANASYTGVAYKDSSTPALMFNLSNGFAETAEIVMLNTCLGVSYYFGKKQ